MAIPRRMYRSSLTLVPDLQVILATIKFVMLTSGVVVAYQSRVVHLAEFNERITLGYAI